MYVTYLITTRTNVPEFGGFEFSVLTRRVRKMVGLDEEKKRMKKKKGDEFFMNLIRMKHWEAL
jgi:hypothetical protein